MAVKMAKGLRGRRRAVRPERAVSCSWSRLQELVPRGGPSKHVPAAEWVISCRTESLGKKKKKKGRCNNRRFKCCRDSILYGVTEQLPFPGAVQGCGMSLAGALGLSGLQGSQLKGFQERNHHNS